MPNLSSKTCLVIDHGLFVEVAIRLAREFGRVYYCDPTFQTAFPTVDHAVIGDGLAEVIRVKEPWDLVDNGNVDLVVYPDVQNAEEQRHIADLGIPVWGARKADRLELDKWRFKKIQEELGMPHAKYVLLRGIDELREYCQDPANDGTFIKMTPQFRGDRETFKHENWESSRQIIGEMDHHFGTLGSAICFLAERPLDGELEGGIDTYSIDGKIPSKVVSGWEIKDKCYFSELVQWSGLHGSLRKAVEPILPILKDRSCRQMLSTEVMLEVKALLEPTVRFPSPAGEQQMELYTNLGEIIYEGAQGRLVQPETEFEFACTAMIDHKGDDKTFRSLKVPTETRRWIKLYNVCQIGDLLVSAPGCDTIGAVIGLGNSPEECLEHLKENAASLDGQPVTVHVPAIAEALQEIAEAQAKGLAFKDEELPEPAAALE